MNPRQVYPDGYTALRQYRCTDQYLQHCRQYRCTDQYLQSSPPVPKVYAAAVHGAAVIPMYMCVVMYVVLATM